MRRPPASLRALLAVATLGAVTIAVPAALGGGTNGVLLPTDRIAAPAGRITPLQVFPTGAAVSPDGRTVVAIAGALVAGGIGHVQVVAVDVGTGQVRQVVTETDALGAVLFRPDGSRVYLAGGSDEAVHVLDVGPAGLLTKDADLPIGDFVTGIALSHDGRYLWAAGSEASRVTRLDLHGGPSRTVAAPYPDQLALSPDDSTLYASDWRGTSVTAIDTTGLTSRRIPVGDHPAGLAVLPDGALLAADANDATLATVPVGGTAQFTDLSQIGRRGDSPSDLAVGPDGRVYVTLAADNAVAVLRRNDGNGGWEVVGLIPTGWYPTTVRVAPDGRTLFVLTGKGLAHSSAATSPYGPDPVQLGVDPTYATVGDLETMAVPDAAVLRADTKQVHRQLRQAEIEDSASRVLRGSQGPIRHVIYVTRENKTYDADLGDLHPGPGNALVLFGQTVTPNLHALERRYVESQAFTYPGWASTVGHLWEDAGGTSDVLERSVIHGGMNDSWRDPTNYPATGLLVGQALHAGLTVRTYNEELAQQSGLLPSQYQAGTDVFPNYDLAVSDTRREQGWESEFRQFERHTCTGTLAKTYGANCQLPSLEYVYLGEDHTTVVDEPGYPTIQAQVADNDYATGRLIDAVSHSPDWASTLVVVVEDDPQGTGDDQSAYRGFIALASPWVKRGYISTTPYNLTSIVGAVDRVLGLPALTDYAATSRPLDDLFASSPDLTPFTADPSGALLYPFTPLPGKAPLADRAHGVCSFAGPDHTDPSVTNAATWAQVHNLPLPVVGRPVTCG